MNKKIWWCFGLLILTAGIIFLTVTGIRYLGREKPCEFEYRCVSGENGLLEVTLSVSNSWTSPGRSFRFPTDGKSVTLKKDGAVFEENGAVVLSVGRGKTSQFTYEIRLGEEGKHGAQGAVTESFCVFDGLHTLLLPEEAYVTGLSGEEVLMERLTVSLEAPEGWKTVNPFEKTEKVTWPDIYDLTNDCFAMGKFETREISAGEKGVLRIHTAEGTDWIEKGPCKEALRTLFDYYQTLFDTEKEYDVIFLPGDTQIIGGAGCHCVGASFDPDKKRDWELLSHRMFHGFLDGTVRGQSLHQAPLLWLVEGLASYYENTALLKMPEEMRRTCGWEENLQFAKLFDQYLYMRYKEPALYQISPMGEANLKSQAQVEFLHYIQAPLMVYWMENISGKDRVLADVLEYYAWDSYSVKDMAERLLGPEFEESWGACFSGTEVLPLWKLGEASREDIQILDHLNEAEATLGSWLQSELGYYPSEVVSGEGLETLGRLEEWETVSYAEPETEENIREYSELIDGLLRENCLRAEKNGYEADDPMARYEVLGNETVRKAWESWVAGGCKEPFK